MSTVYGHRGGPDRRPQLPIALLELCHAGAERVEEPASDGIPLVRADFADPGRDSGQRAPEGREMPTLVRGSFDLIHL